LGADVELQSPASSVTFSNIKFGEIGSTCVIVTCTLPVLTLDSVTVLMCDIHMVLGLLSCHLTLSCNQDLV
jgi:hypothetical protein